MARLKYTSIPTQASWEEILYHEVVQVKDGIAETDDPLSIEALLYIGFELLDDAPKARGGRKPAKPQA